MHPLVPIIRWWLLQLAAIMTALWWPEAGLVLFGGNCFGWWTGDGCCGSSFSCLVCTGATASHATIQADMSGVGSGTCGNCTGYNQSYLLSNEGSSPTCGVAPGNDCSWATTGTASPFDTCELHYSVCFVFGTVNQFFVRSLTINVNFTSTGGLSQNCNSTISGMSYFTGGGSSCNWATGSVNITPL